MIEFDEYSKENQEIDYRYIPKQVKKYLIHDQSIIDSRMDECLKCEHFFKPTSSCKKCGCFMKVKSKVGDFACPVGKWGKVKLEKDNNVAPVI